VKDICNELDVRSLCHKILQNVSTLLHADRGSLFLVQGERERASCCEAKMSRPRCNICASAKPKRYLVSKLFDVCSRSTLQEMEKKDEIRIPWGTGIVGFVAESGEPVNIPDAYKVKNPPVFQKTALPSSFFQNFNINILHFHSVLLLFPGIYVKLITFLLQDDRFNHDIDVMTGYKTRTLLCMPIKDINGDVLGVAQVRTLRKSRRNLVAYIHTYMHIMAFIVHIVLDVL